VEQESRGVLRGRCRQVKPPPSHAGPSKCMLWSQILLLGVKFLDTVLRCRHRTERIIARGARHGLLLGPGAISCATTRLRASAFIRLCMNNLCNQRCGPERAPAHCNPRVAQFLLARQHLRRSPVSCGQLCCIAHGVKGQLKPCEHKCLTLQAPPLL
jgi:hypothetical protein